MPLDAPKIALFAFFITFMIKYSRSTKNYWKSSATPKDIYMARRIGLRTIRNLAFQMCGLIGKFTPAIKSVYPSNVLLHAALDAANAACGVLVSEADNAFELGD